MSDSGIALSKTLLLFSQTSGSFGWQTCKQLQHRMRISISEIGQKGHEKVSGLGHLTSFREEVIIFSDCIISHLMDDTGGAYIKSLFFFHILHICLPIFLSLSRYLPPSIHPAVLSFLQCSEMACSRGLFLKILQECHWTLDF